MTRPLQVALGASWRGVGETTEQVGRTVQGSVARKHKKGGRYPSSVPLVVTRVCHILGSLPPSLCVNDLSFVYLFGTKCRESDCQD